MAESEFGVLTESGVVSTKYQDSPYSSDFHQILPKVADGNLIKNFITI